jgi:MraZ protein
MEIDASGRILIPEFLREFAGLKDHVVFIGVHDRIEIWNDKRWSTYRKTLESDSATLAEKFGSVLR